MLIKELYQKLKESPRFKASGFLSHVFVTADLVTDTLVPEGLWEFGFYDASKDIVHSYALQLHTAILDEKESQVFKKESDTVHPIDLDELTLDFEEAASSALSFQKKSYAGQSPGRAMFVLQDLGAGLIWNVTFVTTAFNVLNMKFAAGRRGEKKSGEIIFHELSNLMQWKK